MRHRNPLNDTVATLSLLLTWTTAAQGKRLFVVVPLQHQELDGRPGVPALFATIQDCNLYAPPGFRLAVSHTDYPPGGGPRAFDGEFTDPIADVRYTLQFEITVPDDAAAKTGALLAFYGQTIATSVIPPEADEWPAVEPLAAPGGCLVVKDASGSVVPCHIVEL